MKNKYLAITLSIVAVIVVAYRIFFSSQEKVTPPPQSTPPPIIHDPAEVDPGFTPNMMSRSESKISIEIDPQQLLYPIDIKANRYLKRELPKKGKAILTQEDIIRPKDKGISNQEDIEKEYKFVLFATILDHDRKIAVINSRICEVGDILEGGAIVRSIARGEVTILFKDQSISLLINPNIRKINYLEGDKNEI